MIIIFKCPNCSELVAPSDEPKEVDGKLGWVCCYCKIFIEKIDA